MNQKLTWDEIKQRHPNEWVALVDSDWPDTLPDPLAGVVFAHHPDKKKLFGLAHELKSKAVLWTGRKLGCALMAAVDVDGDV